MTTTEESVLRREAYVLAREIHDGRWDHVVTSGLKSLADSEELITELRLRCPGFERAAYEKAIASGLSEFRPPPIRNAISFWFVALTFVWAIIVPVLAKRLFAGSNEAWGILFGYPIACTIAAVFLILRKRNGRLIFAGINVLSAVSWIIVVIWIVRAIGKNLWR